MYCENCEGIVPVQVMIRIDRKKIDRLPNEYTPSSIAASVKKWETLFENSKTAMMMDTFKCPRCGDVRKGDRYPVNTDYEIKGNYPKELISIKEKDPEEYKGLCKEADKPKRNISEAHAKAFADLLRRSTREGEIYCEKCESQMLKSKTEKKESEVDREARIKFGVKPFDLVKDIYACTECDQEWEEEYLFPLDGRW